MTVEVPKHDVKLDSGEYYRVGELSGSTGDPLPDEQSIQAFFSALMQSDHLSLLVGAGLSKALVGAARRRTQPSKEHGLQDGQAAEGAADASAMDASLSTGDDLLDGAISKEASRLAAATGRGKPNLEDHLSAALSIHRGLSALGDPRTEKLGTAVYEALRELVDSVTADEALLATPTHLDDGAPAALGSAFLGSFASRLATRDRLHVFTTNYDRVIEWVADRSGLRVLDRFVGTLTPVFRSSRLEIDYHYSPPGSIRDPRHLEGVVRLTKLHGSLDWIWADGVQRVPTRFGQKVVADDALLIYPQAAKDFETTHYPYSELFRDFAAAICRPESVLVSYGYSFGDSHVNRVIRDMLTIPSTHLMVIARSDDDGRLKRFTDSCHPRQVSLLVGPTFGGLPNLVSKWLPWPTLSRITARQAELIRAMPASDGPDHADN